VIGIDLRDLLVHRQRPAGRDTQSSARTYRQPRHGGLSSEFSQFIASGIRKAWPFTCHSVAKPNASKELAIHRDGGFQCLASPLKRLGCRYDKLHNIGRMCKKYSCGDAQFAEESEYTEYLIPNSARMRLWPTSIWSDGSPCVALLFASACQEGGLPVFRWCVAPLLMVLTVVSHVDAQEWARAMFKVTNHDFGAVARGSKTEFLFEFENIYKEDVHVASVRSSCGCTDAKIEADLVKTWEKGAIKAVFNTRAFLGHRSATLTVTFDKPYFAEVQLSVRGYIRGDVVFDPGSVVFNDVDQGAAAERVVNVSYAGRSTWEIVDVRSANPHFEVELLDENRAGGRVSYKMLVRLKGDAAEGYFQDQLVIVTNDLSMSRLELPVEGRVASALTVSPASLFLGVLKPNQKVTKKLVVRGKTPFKIVDIKCPNGCFHADRPEEAKRLHLIPITFTADDQPRKVSEKIEIQTDLNSGATTSCIASATITSADAD
jgi:hypothetical protein